MSKIRRELRQLSPAKRLLGLLPVLVVAFAMVAALSGVGVAGATEPEAGSAAAAEATVQTGSAAEAKPTVETTADAGNAAADEATDEKTIDAGATADADSTANASAATTDSIDQANDADAKADASAGAEATADEPAGEEEAVTYAANGVIRRVMSPKAGAPTVDLFDYDASRINSGHDLTFSHGADNPGWNHYTGTGKGVYQGIVSKTLGSDGNPVLAVKGRGSLGYLFSSGDSGVVASHTGVTGLFYDEDGYYTYDANEHFAQYLENSNSFNVEDDPRSSNDDPSVPKFLPFNNITDSGSFNYHFGMKMVTDFIMPEGGKVNNQDMIFEFSGDDDVWVFVDGKLVLDLGGIHDNYGGKINFNTGEVTYTGNGVLGSHANGISQNLWELVSGTEKNPTATKFSDYSTHTLSFFYLERGAGGSNCKLKFNLPSIPEGSFDFGKKVDYANVNNVSDIDFQFKAYVNTDGDATTVGEDGKFTLYTGSYAVYNSSDPNTVVETRTTGADGIITLKDGQFARLSSSNNLTIKRNSKYYVQEVGATSDKYSVTLTGTTNTDGKQDNNGYTSALQTVKDALHITFNNTVQATNAFDLIVKKTVAGNDNGDTYYALVKVGNKAYSGEYRLYTSDSATNYETKSTTKGVIELKAGEHAEIVSLMGGNTVTVTEVTSATDTMPFTASATYKDPVYSAENTSGTVYATATTTDGVTFKANEGKQLGTNPVATATIKNELKTASFLLTKVDSEDPNTKLGGAKFTLTQGKGADLKYVQSDGKLGTDTYEFETSATEGDTKGTFLISNLLPGDYALTETEAPTGYTADATSRTLHVAFDDDGDLTATLDNDTLTVNNGTVQVTVSNTRREVELVIEKKVTGAGADTTKPFTFTVTGVDGSIKDYEVTTSGIKDKGSTTVATLKGKDGTNALHLRYGDKVTISENDAADYSTSYALADNKNGSINTSETATTITLTPQTATNGVYQTKVIATNYKGLIPITGIASGSHGTTTLLGILAAVGVAIAGGFALVQSRATEATAGDHVGKRNWHLGRRSEPRHGRR